MRILHVISTLRKEYGGPVAALLAIVHKFAGLGVDVEVVSLDKEPDPIDGIAATHFLGPVAGELGTGVYSYSKRLLPWLIENTPRFDAVIVHGIWQYQGLACWRAFRRSGVPYFVFVHGALDPWFKKRYPLKHLKKWLYWPWAEYRVLRDARGVLFTTDEERVLARESFWLYRANEIVVSYGTERPPTRSEEWAVTFRQKFNIATDDRCLLFMSRIHEKKGCDLLIRAFAKEMTDPRSRLIMAGPDHSGIIASYQGLCRRLDVEGRVTWTGMLEGELKWGAFFASEAFALTSHSENFGVAVVEALGCGVPVLISDKVNIWREVEQDRAGIVEPDTLDGAASLLRRWRNLTDAEKSEMRSNAVTSFDKRYEISSVARGLVAAIRSSLGREKSA